MSYTPKKVLFISHDASRTGAPLLLLRLLRWLKAQSDISFEILLCQGGELENAFAAIAPVSVLHKNMGRPGIATRLRELFSDGVSKRLRQAGIERHSLSDIGLIYSNTIVNGDILEALSVLNCPVITHVHELENAIQAWGGSENIAKVRRYTRHYIAVSEAVKRNLVEQHQIPESKISVVPGFLSIEELDEARASPQENLRQQLGIAADAPVVCSAGTLGWRKGGDIFIQLTRHVLQEAAEPVHFLWIGADKKKDFFTEIQHDVKKMGIEQYVHFIETTPEPLRYMACCDVLVVVSREDSFSLVCLEAAALGKPVVCFDATGGIQEFVEDDAGFVVPYLDVPAMAAKVVTLLRNPALRHRLGEQAKQKVNTTYTVAARAPDIVRLIEAML